MLSFFPRDVLHEIWDLIESVSEGFPTYSFSYGLSFLFSLTFPSDRHGAYIIIRQVMLTTLITSFFRGGGGGGGGRGRNPYLIYAFGRLFHLASGFYFKAEATNQAAG